jgi:WhiB family redox-sensing transcriptional regulator
MTAPVGGTAWMSRGACRGEDPDIFFPVGNAGPALTQTAEAKAVCARCPVMDACLDWALSRPERSGVWGGMSGEERDAIRRYGGSDEAVRRAVLEREVRSFHAEHGSERRSRHRWQDPATPPARYSDTALAFLLPEIVAALASMFCLVCGDELPAGSERCDACVARAERAA